MEWIVVTVAIGLSIAAGATAVMARRHGWRWGRVRTGTAGIGEGPFRESHVGTYQPHGVPAGVSFASVTSIIWGLLTALVFAPAGLLFCLVAADISPLACLAVLGVSIHGFVLAARLCGASGALMRRDVRAVANVVRASIIHHLAVIATFGFTWLAAGTRDAGDGGYVFMLAAVPCMLGLGLALQLGSAGTASTPDE